MIRISLIKEGIDINRIRIVPHFGYYETENWKDFIPREASIVLSAKDKHHYEKIKVYKENGWKVELIEPVKGVSGTIFGKEWPDGNWEELVPEGTRTILRKKLREKNNQ